MRDGAAGRDREYALSEVIGFILLLGVLTAAFALWMMYIVPANGREDEINQMNTVKDQFTDYKISLDSLWINGQSGVLLSTSMNLGTGGGNTQSAGLFLPLMHPVASSATLSVRDYGDRMTISSLGPNDGGVVQSNSYIMSVLEYQSQNNYWIQQQYYYQEGGVFLSQLNGSTCRVAPPVSFAISTSNTHYVTITPITLDNTGSMGGNGPVRVDSRIRTLTTPVPDTKYWVNTSVRVANYTAAQVWLDVFNTSRRTGGIYDARNYSCGNSSPTAIPGFAFMNITGYPPNDMTNADVLLTVQPVNYSVTINSISSNLN
jgi:hypothetical protein